MFPTRYLEKFLQQTQPHLQEIVLELRNIIASVAPTATETVLWKGLSYYDEKRGGPISAGICQISVHENHVRLAFIHGSFLSDPQHLLEGDQKYKRFVRIQSFENAPWDYLKDLITSSSHFDPRSLQTR
jgi:hypothetical protein